MGQRIRSQAPQLLRREAAKKTMHAGMPRVPARPTATTAADHVIDHHTTPIAFWKKSLLTSPARMRRQSRWTWRRLIPGVNRRLYATSPHDTRGAL